MGTKLEFYDLVKMGMRFTQEIDSVTYAYFEFDLDYIGIPRSRFKHLKEYFQPVTKSKPNNPFSAHETFCSDTSCVMYMNCT
jgi:hypothetical protein